MLLTVIMLNPNLWFFFSTFKNQSEIFKSGVDLFPKVFTLKNYVISIKGVGNYNFFHFMKNSFVISIWSVLGTLFSSSVVAFGFSRIEFKGRKLFFSCMIATLMLPYQIIMVPQYVIFSQLGWVNSYLPIIVPTFLGDAFFIFLVVQFIRGIPKELDESAFIDGASVYRIFISIILPLLKTPLITVAIFRFYWSWEQLIQPMIYLNKVKLYPIPVALSMWSDPGSGTNYGALLSMGFMSLIPVTLIFALLQRYIVEGVSTQGLKG
jgi:multiple sugar transport system permease protein